VSAWLEVLRAECQRRSQSAVARELGYSPPVISQVLQGKYPGAVDRIRRLVEGRYMNATVECPVLDEIPVHECLQHQSEPFMGTSSMRTRLWIACNRTCPHSDVRRDYES